MRVLEVVGGAPRIECGILEPQDVYELTTPTATEPTEITITFERGLPVALDGRSLDLSALIGEVDRIVGSYGWGRIDMIENRRVGIKSRRCTSAPGRWLSSWRTRTWRT